MGSERNNDVYNVHCNFFCLIFAIRNTKKLYRCAPVLDTYIYRLYTRLKCALKIMLKNLTHVLY